MLVFEGRDGYFGLLVDAVGEVLTVFPQGFEQNPSILDEQKRALFAGAYKLSDSLLVVLDPGRFDPVQLPQ
jgi:purine-binding chemotaxis protein CheW